MLQGRTSPFEVGGVEILGHTSTAQKHAPNKTLAGCMFGTVVFDGAVFKFAGSQKNDSSPQ
jgi:hypothetical protein